MLAVALNADILIDFMKRLIRDARRKVYLANAGLKQAVTKLAPARTKLQLVKAAARHLHSVQWQPNRIKSHFQHELVRYAARVQQLDAGSIASC